MTRSRKEILAILREAESPVSAIQVAKGFPDEAGPDQATVYRTLHWLEENGFADSFVLHCSNHGTERYYSAIRDPGGNQLPHRHWFHCVACHRFTDLGTCGLRGLLEGYERDLGLRIEGHTLYCTGLCADCGGAPDR